MSIPDVLPLSPPSTSSRRRTNPLSSSTKTTSTPDSSASFPGSSNAGSRKRVGFSTDANAQPRFPSSEAFPNIGRPIVVPSNSQPNLRSILKPGSSCGSGIQTTDGLGDNPQSVFGMMDSFILQLSRDDRSVSVAAYQTLASLMRQYDELPEADVLKEKINTFMRFIKRDLLRKPSAGEQSIADSNLMTQALKVSIIFVWNKDFASLLSDENRTFILDRSIQILNEHTAPKSVVIHFLHLLAAQNFRQTLITGNRVVRLLEALKALSEHYSGNNVVSERLLVYQKLLDQERPTMKARANWWIEELLSGMCHSMKEIRTKGIDLGLKACSGFPVSSSISAVVRSALAKELEGGKTFSSSMCRKLEKILLAKQHTAQVPQIWAIVFRLCNNVDDRGRNFWGANCDKWPQFKEWMSVMQRCLNCSETAVLQQSYQAWNRFIHVAQPHVASNNLLSLLARPITTKLERGGGDQSPKGTRMAAVSSYCTLLYYAFRPAATHEQYSRVWVEYVGRVMKPSFFEHCSLNADLVSRLFMALFWNSTGTAKIWNENRALENTSITPEELPTIDCKWLRSKTLPILEIFEILMRYSSWGSSGQSSKAYIAMAWVHFLRALRESCRKEIKPSADTIEAMTHVTTFLGRSWLQLYEPVAVNGQSTMVNIAPVRKLTADAITILGHDLIMAGLSEKGLCLSKALAIYDAVDYSLGQIPADEPGSAVFIECQRTLDSALVQDYKSEPRTRIAEGISQLYGRMEQWVAQDIIHTLVLLKKATLLILQEDLQGPNDDSHKGNAGIASVTMAFLSTLPRTVISELDDTFAALLSCNHRQSVQAAVAMWNVYFGRQASLDMGPQLSEVLAKLQTSGVAVIIPRKALPNDQSESQHWASTQQGPIAVLLDTPTSHASPAFVTGAKGGEESPELASQMRPTVEEYLALNVNPQHPTSRPRSRHDDSQIHFVPIESSPFPEEEPESQLLTTHQKEVRDRQRAEPAVVFPDLLSSPIPRARSVSRGDSRFARKVADQPERPSTPTLPTNDDHGDAEIMASPTPRARHIASHITDTEVPSSPLSAAGNNDRQEITSSPPRTASLSVKNNIDLIMSDIVTQNERVPNRLAILADEAIVETKAHCGEEDVEMREAHATGLVEDQQQDDQVAPSPMQETGKEPISANELGQVQNDTEDDEPNLAQRAAAAFSSLRPITINIASDSTTKEDAEANEPSPVTEARVECDDIDILSASQLSHDLDQHVSQTAVLEDQDVQTQPCATLDAEHQEERRQSISKLKSRKRKSSSQKFTSVKRRKSQAGSQRSSTLAEAESFPYDAPGELLDCIEVSPSQAVQAIEPEHLGVPSSPPKRRRGRPRKTPVSTSRSPRQDILTSQMEDETDVSFETARIADEDQPDDLAVMEQDPCAESEQASKVQVAGDAMVSNGPEQAFKEMEETMPDLGRPQSSIVASLETVLSRLKSATPGDIDLRMVDDLCFQIRFQAQIAAQHRGT